MAWTDPNAKDFTVGQVLTSNEMDTYVLANTADLDDRLVNGLLGFSTTLTNDSVAALNTWEQYGTEEATAADPGRAIAVIATVTAWGTVPAGTTNREARTRVQISLDGGTSWTDGQPVRGHLDRADAGIATVPQTSHHTASGTPTGQVQVRVQIYQAGGAAGDVTWTEGSLIALMIPVGN